VGVLKVISGFCIPTCSKERFALVLLLPTILNIIPAYLSSELVLLTFILEFDVIVTVDVPN